MKSRLAVFFACLTFFLSACDRYKSDERTPTKMSVIINALERYKEKFGEYPEPANPALMGSGSLSGFRVGGALMLYQVVTGDGDDQILLKEPPGKNHAGTAVSDGILDSRERQKTFNVDLPTDMVLATGSGRMLVDGWGHPFQYEHGGNSRVPNANTVNAGFDIWSIGSMKPEHAPKSPSKLQKQDQTLTMRWIKNW
jgi:hypothetical protein